MNRSRNNYILIFTVLFFLLWPIKDFGFSSIVFEIILMVLIIIYLLLNKIKLTITKFNIPFFIISIVLLLLFLLPNASSNYIKTRPIIINFLLCAILIFSAKENNKVFNIFKKLSIFFSTLFCFFNTVSVLFPSIYINYIFPLLSGPTHSKARYYLNSGYGPPIDGEAAYLPYILVFGISIVISELLTNKRTIKISLFLLINYFLSLFLYGRRSELLSIVVSLYILYLVVNRKTSFKSIIKRIFIMFFIIVTIYILYILMNNGYFIRIAKTIQEIKDLSSSNIEFSDINSVSTNRIVLWKKAFDEFLSSPIYGIGWGRFTYKYGINVHNTYLQFLCESGIIGFLLLIVPMLVTYIRTIQIMIVVYKSSHANARESITISFILQSFFLVLNFLDPAFYKTYHIFLYAICVILLEYSYKTLISNSI